MILRSIKVEGWRCFADPIEIGPFDERLNVLHAPNGTGKSKLLEALLRAFFDSHRVTGREVEALQPWGRSLSPRVVIEFACGGEEYCLQKGFLEDAHATLQRREDGRFVRLAEADAADEQVRQLLLGSAPGRGMSKHGHWGLAQVLWAPQTSLALTELSDDLVTGVRQSLGAQVAGAAGGRIEKQIESLYLEIYTPTGRIKRTKDAPRVATLEEQLETLQGQRKGLLQRLHAFEETSREVRDLAARRAQALCDLEELRKQLATARDEAKIYGELAGKREALALQLEAATTRTADLARRIDRIMQTRKALAEIETAERTRNADEPAILAEREMRRTAEREAVAAVERLRAAREESDAARARLEAARRVTALRETVATHGEVIERAVAEAAQIEKLSAQCVKIVAPDAKGLRSIRQALKTRDELRTQLDAALITLEIEPLQAMRLAVLAGDTPGAQPLEPGTPIVLRGSPAIEIEIPQIARIRARGPAQEVPLLREKLVKAERVLADLTTPFGTQDLDAIERLAESRGDLERRIASAQERLETILGDEPLDARRQTLARAQAELREILRDHPAWQTQPPDLEAMEIEEAELRKRRRADEKRCDVELDIARTAFAAAERRWQEHESERRDLTRKRGAATGELDELLDDGLEERERRERWDKSRLSQQQLDASLQDAREQLDQFAGDPRVELARAEKAQRAAEASERALLEQERAADGRLQQLCVEAPYTAVAEVEEEAARLSEEHAREMLRASAIRLLHETVARLRREAVASVAGPVEERATRTFHRIAGGRLGRVELSSRFEPRQVRPGLASEAVDLDELSGGEKEQLHLAVRLALAELIASEERQLVVLDDILTATDTPRLARIHTILEEAAGRLQVLVLTCHPERYRALESAHFMDLRSMLGN